MPTITFHCLAICRRRCCVRRPSSQNQQCHYGVRLLPPPPPPQPLTSQRECRFSVENSTYRAIQPYRRIQSLQQQQQQTQLLKAAMWLAEMLTLCVPCRAAFLAPATTHTNRNDDGHAKSELLLCRTKLYLIRIASHFSGPMSHESRGHSHIASYQARHRFRPSLTHPERSLPPVPSTNWRLADSHLSQGSAWVPLRS